MNNKILAALEGKNEGRAPFWFMRQAGRYCDRYQSYRQKHSLKSLFLNPELAAEITLIPTQELGVDAAILFSDILVIAHALGRGLDFHEGLGPVIDKPIRCADDVHKLPLIEVNENLAFVRQTIEKLQGRLEVPLLGFAGSPFTLAAYLIEGGRIGELARVRAWIYQDPKSFEQLLEKLFTLTKNYLQMQIDAGVSALQVFESCGHQLDAQLWGRYCKPYLLALKNELRVPTLLFARGATGPKQLIEAHSKERSKKRLNLSVDWHQDLQALRAFANEREVALTLQGNLDPAALYLPEEALFKKVEQLLKTMQGDRAYIFNLGHGVLPTTPKATLKKLCQNLLSAEPAPVS